MDYADSVVDEGITVDEVEPDVGAGVEREIAKRKAALKRA